MGVKNSSSIIEASTTKSLREKVQKQLISFFNKQIENLGLGIEQINRQSKFELKNSLKIVNDAIDHAESFGVLKLKISATAGVFVASAKQDIHFEMGILSLLLERKKIIQDRLEQLKEESDIEGEVGRLKRKIKRYSFWLRFSFSLAIVIGGICVIFLFSSTTSWQWLSQHPHETGLKATAIFMLLGISWIIVDTNKRRRWFALSSIVLAALLGIIQML